jgi:hypothetical protein
VRVVGHKSDDCARDDNLQEIDWAAHPHAPARYPTHVLYYSFRVFGLRHHHAAAFIKALANLSNLQSASASLYQTDAQLGFQFG